MHWTSLMPPQAVMPRKRFWLFIAAAATVACVGLTVFNLHTPNSLVSPQADLGTIGEGIEIYTLDGYCAFERGDLERFEETGDLGGKVWREKARCRLLKVERGMSWVEILEGPNRRCLVWVGVLDVSAPE